MPPTSDPGRQRSNARNPQSLAAAAEAWLPTSDPAAHATIVAFLQQIESAGADPIAELRVNIDRWFGSAAAFALPPSALTLGKDPGPGLVLEPLNALRQPTLWPQRPKRLPDELLSSWLWRTAVSSGVPPRVFARETLDAAHIDTDHNIGLASLRRLAQMTGQTFGHLAGGLLQLLPEATYDTRASIAENFLLADKGFLLANSGGGNACQLLQFCPRCLRADERPHFRRSWRFGPIAICLEHGCRLHDRCWRCDKPVVPLAFRAIGPDPRCLHCESLLADAPVQASRGRARQAALQEMLHYVAVQIPTEQRAPHREALRRHFGGSLRGPVREREAVVAGLSALSAKIWFGRPDDRRHAEKLNLLAQGVNSASLAAAALSRRHRRSRQAAKQKIVAAYDQVYETRRRGGPDYSDARTEMWKLIELHRARMDASARQGVQSADQKQ